MRSASSMVANAGTAAAVVERAGLVLRAASALVLAPVAVGATLLGGPAFDLLIAAGAGVLVWEWGRLCGEGRFGHAGTALLGFVLATVLAASLSLVASAVALTLGGALVVDRLAVAQGDPRPHWRGAGVLYVGVPATALLWLRDVAHGDRLVLWLFIVVWATDIGAYAVGRLVGGPRLAPRLSPHKTWAGLGGGIAAAAAAGAAAARGFASADAAILTVLSAVLAVVAQIGDLVESAVKRHFKVKDMSSLIPGHGGLFDRVDGLLAAAPAVALVQLIWGGSVLAWR